MLYAITLAGQWFAAVVRILCSYIVLALIALITGWPIPSNWIALAIGFAPLVVSLLALLLPPLIAPLDGRWWEISSGGRPPEQDEQRSIRPRDRASYANTTLSCASPGTGSSPKTPARTPPPTPKRCASTAACSKAPTRFPP